MANPSGSNSDLLDQFYEILVQQNCETCEGGGWVMSNYQGEHPPKFETCPTCYNPCELPSP